MLNKIKNFMNRPITWGDSFKYAAGFYAVWGILMAGVWGYFKFRDWYEDRMIKKQIETEERPEW